MPRVRRISPWLAALLVAATAGVAAAAPPRGSTAVRDALGRHLVPADAAAVVRADPDELERAAELARSLGGEVGLATNLATLAAATALGFDPLSRLGWRSVGLDSEQPVLVALGRIDPTAPRSVWHLRVIARVADPGLFAQWAAHVPVTGEPWRPDRARRGELAPLLGIDARDAAAESDAARALAALDAVSVGAAARLGALLVVRRSGPFAVIDAFAPSVAQPITWARDGEWILAQLAGPASRRALIDRASAATRALAQPGVVLWTQAAGLFDAVLTWARPPATCLAFRDLLARTALSDGAAALRLTPGQISLDLVWGGSARAAHAWTTADDGLVGPPLRAGAILAASLYLGSTARLRGLPRPSLVDGGWVSLWRQVRTCGRHARVLLVGFAWPELAAQWLSDVASVSPQAARLVGGIRNIGFSARRVSAGDRRAWRAVLEGSLSHEAQAPARAIVDAIFGSRTSERRPRPHTAWAGEYLHPYVLSRGRRGAVLGVAIGGDSREWRVAQPLARGRRAAGGVLAQVAGDAAAILRQLAPDLSPRLRSLATAAVPRVGLFAGSLAVLPDGMRASILVRRP
jgi:hypothetical protein